jgi:hypothetical protein
MGVDMVEDTENTFENPANKYRVEIFSDLTPLWAFLFGPLHSAYRGLWANFVGGLIIIAVFSMAGAGGFYLAVFGVATFNAFTVKNSLIEKYKQKGWLEVVNGKAVKEDESPGVATSSMMEELEKLSALHKSGDITQEEFEAGKKKIFAA